MKRTVLVGLVLVLAGIAAFIAYRAAQPGGQPLVIGLVSSLTGRFSALSGAGRDGAVLAVEHVNARGGVAGRPLSLVIRDDAFDQDQAGRAFVELAMLGAPAVVGPFASAMALPMLQAAPGVDVLIVSPTVSSDDFTGKDDLLVRVIPATASYSRAIGEHVAKGRGVGRLAVIVDQANAAYTASAVRAVREGFSGSGGREMEVIEYDSRTAPSFQALAAKALALKPDGVLMISSPLDTALLCQHLRLADKAIPLFSSAWGMSGELIESGGRAVEGVQSVVPYDPGSGRQPYQEFARAFTARFGKGPDFSSMYNYEAVMLLADALSAAPRAKGEELKRVILSRNPCKGLQNDFVMDKYGDVSRPLYLLTVENGTLKAEE